MRHCLATDKKNAGAAWHCFTANNPALQGVHLRDEIMKILMNRRRRVRYRFLYRAQRHFIANIFSASLLLSLNSRKIFDQVLLRQVFSIRDEITRANYAIVSAQEEIKRANGARGSILLLINSFVCYYLYISLYSPAYSENAIFSTARNRF